MIVKIDNYFRNCYKKLLEKITSLKFKVLTRYNLLSEKCRDSIKIAGSKVIY